MLDKKSKSRLNRFIINSELVYITLQNYNSNFKQTNVIFLKKVFSVEKQGYVANTVTMW
ncbi:hypothetical protein Palpr_2450 [Paludibacter propionicigenes WB4]|uniref:Uncharacterized protein n=1 Tax=Paludibacter propionicigenes (strain DSM 17365 / JCM 13257 / WB4) TaxID=694427 RepID=E4T788_PALPW|nr:hypothetical protein Palpr_2450 [Paludibacter propionicigenes WB4]